MVTPVVVNPFRREVVIDFGDRYEKGNLWFDPMPHFRPAGFGIAKGFELPEVQQALQSPLAQRVSPLVAVSVRPGQSVGDAAASGSTIIATPTSARTGGRRSSFSKIATCA